MRSFKNRFADHADTFRRARYIAVIVFVFAIYVFGIWENPPGFYVDESALSYNAYLVSQTGAGEFGPKFPLYFQIYTGGFTQWSNPTHIYILAAAFKIFGPGIVTARLVAAFFVFCACILIGFLARRISGRDIIGVIVGSVALLTPWWFEVGRLVLECFIYPLATVLLLWSVYRVSKKDAWSWPDAAVITGALTLLTYSYTIGRLLGPLLAGGLVLFAVNRERIISVAKVWAVYLAAFIPLVVYMRQRPELSTRFYLISYIKQDSKHIEIIPPFLKRYLEDINPLTMLLVGDTNPRHHLPDAHGSFYAAVFVLAVIGLVLVIMRHRRSSWWLYVVFGAAVSVIPGSLTVDKFHTLRMLAMPAFLFTLTIPALEWLLNEKDKHSAIQADETELPSKRSYWQTARGAVLAGLLLFGSLEAAYFHLKYYRHGDNRGYAFDQDYKPLYDQAVAQPLRPIYLVDGYWGPAYIHSFWYATLEGRDRGEFVHQSYGKRPPPGSIVISSEQACTTCEMISKNGTFLLYRTR